MMAAGVLSILSRPSTWITVTLKGDRFVNAPAQPQVKFISGRSLPCRLACSLFPLSLPLSFGVEFKVESGRGCREGGDWDIAGKKWSRIISENKSNLQQTERPKPLSFPPQEAAR